MAKIKEWENWFTVKLQQSELRWQDERQDYTRYSSYDLLCEQLMREAENRWRLKYDETPSYTLLMRALANAQYALDKRPWDNSLVRWSKLRRWSKRQIFKVFRSLHR